MVKGEKCKNQEPSRLFENTQNHSLFSPFQCATWGVMFKWVYSSFSVIKSWPTAFRLIIDSFLKPTFPEHMMVTIIISNGYIWSIKIYPDVVWDMARPCPFDNFTTSTSAYTANHTDEFLWHWTVVYLKFILSRTR